MKLFSRVFTCAALFNVALGMFMLLSATRNWPWSLPFGFGIGGAALIVTAITLLLYLDRGERRHHTLVRYSTNSSNKPTKGNYHE